MDSIIISRSRIMKNLISGWIYQGYPLGFQDLHIAHINTVVFEQDYAIVQTTLFYEMVFQNPLQRHIPNLKAWIIYQA